MTRPTRIQIDQTALIHNLGQVKAHAPHSKIIAMVKANAYGCGIASVIPTLESGVDAFGVASLEEALAIRALGSRKDCILFQGIFSPDELQPALLSNIQIVIHQRHQLEWLMNSSLTAPLKVWVKVDTGMHRLGFEPNEVNGIIQSLRTCSWVHPDIGLMSHFACADEVDNPTNFTQIKRFNHLQLPKAHYIRSFANSAAILSLPESHADAVRPGIMLYGVSPFVDKTGLDIGLLPVMHFSSAISAIHYYPPFSPVGYGASWQSEQPSIIGVVPAGYGDGYPRHIKNGQVWINGCIVPVVGRVSMDMLTIDLTSCPHVKVADRVELWGSHIPVETVAKKADTIAYELLCKVAPRVRS
ncbi:alanine racemase [Legionella yabuuchiae]|uniref:alanine racemase n=1 Tax=Legionella yabuuchiae TaxID=376727 RepID=UPI001056DCC9|nr:alanine racemase [Legionella yabuuchiae]